LFIVLTIGLIPYRIDWILKLLSEFLIAAAGTIVYRNSNQPIEKSNNMNTSSFRHAAISDESDQGLSASGRPVLRGPASIGTKVD